ncbi:MAG: nucleotidyltransferase domain-containing protein [Archaeoglobus sp.]|nr:nucleotidyltransferase domain-containing protein [Archaeoglobus sp.]
MELGQNIVKIIESIKNHPDVIAIYLFGSYAKGEQTPMSDVDIAVILGNLNPENEAEVGSLISPEIDVVLFHRLPLHIKFEIFRYGKELFVRDEGKLVEIKLEVMREYLDTYRMYKRISSEVLG